MAFAGKAAINRLVAVVATAGATLLAARLALELSPASVVAGAFGAAAVALIIVRPEAGCLVLLFLMALVDRDVWFEQAIPFAGGGLKAPELIVGLTLASWAAAMIVRPERYRRPPTWMLIGLAGVSLTAVAGLLTARAAGTPLNESMVELRPFLIYLLVLPVAGAALSMRDLEVAVGLFLGACALSAGEALWRYLAGEGVHASYAGGALRVVTSDAFLYPMLAAVWSLVLLGFSGSGRTRLLLSLLAALSVAALFFTFQRGAWLAALAATALAFLLLPRRQRTRAAAYVLPLVGLCAAAVVALNSLSVAGTRDPLASGLERLASVEEPQRDVSSQHRVREWDRSLELVEAHPVTGIGLGGSITFWSPLYSEARKAMGGSFRTFYIHNSYIWLALKLGVPGLLALVGFLIATLGVGTRAYLARTEPRRRRLLLGGVLTLVTMLLVSFSGPHLTVERSSIAVACAVALIVAASRIQLAQARPS
jgi:O-antigen ligase